MRIVGAASLVVLMATPMAQAAPKGLYGKSVTVTWNETRSQRDGQSGPFRSVSIPYLTTYYVSGEGHVFTRTTAKGATGAGFGSADRVGATGSDGTGNARNVAFSGNKIVANTAFGGAGRHVEVTFDGSFASCSAQVITAMPKGAKTAVVRSVSTGGNVEFESVSAGPANCSIASGNPF